MDGENLSITGDRMNRLRGVHQGRPALIVAAGPSAPNDIARCITPGSVIIAVNYHAYYLFDEAAIDYAVFMDAPHTSAVPYARWVLDHPHRISTCPEHSDYDLRNIPIWHSGWSSGLAAWSACWMGCDPVILCGMDCFGSGRYFHRRMEEHEVPVYRLTNYRRIWNPDTLPEIMRHRMQVASGPLHPPLPLAE